MQMGRTSDVWWKNAVFYCVDVELFQDSDGDGIGDFQGLGQRIDYLSGLGVTCLWLMPFYPSPNRDDGYDITDYYAVDPRLGSLGDLVEVVRLASDRGIRVIADLVVNHTSAEHPWFQAARADRNSRYRDWYVWQDRIPEDGPDGLIFPGQQQSNWSWDERAGQHYLHRFYAHQPDLNIANPAVREEIRKIVGFWLELGLSGFRIDAVPYLLETEGIARKMEIAPHSWLRDLRAFVGRRRGDAVLMGEVNLEPEQVRRYFGGDGGGELHMCLNFNLNQMLALSILREDAGPLIHGLRSLPSLARDDQWGNFVRNHDEWTLDKLTDAERAELFKAFGPKPEMQIFGRGLRRRLPTMLDGDQARIRMVYATMMALPGAPVLFYGEEIGMAENLEIPGRMSVRAPMQWSSERNGGFSTAPPDRLRRPIVPGRRWRPAALNVAAQRQDDGSLLNWMARLIRRRRETPEIGFGAFQLVRVPDAPILALRYDWAGRTVLVIHNLGRSPRRAALELETAGDWDCLVDVFGCGESSLQEARAEVALDGYGCRWLRVRRNGETILL
jgi:trehalose synthase